MIATGIHDLYLVALSILVASFASYTALDLGGRVGTARGLSRSNSSEPRASDAGGRRPVNDKRNGGNHQRQIGLVETCVSLGLVDWAVRGNGKEV